MSTPQTQPNNTPALTPEQQKKQAAKNRMSSLKATLAAPSVLEQFKNVLAENSGPFIASIIDLYNGSADLQECDPNAVIFEALKAASLKLPINKSIGFAYLVAYKGVPTMIVGYKGYIQLAMRTGQYRFINADEVFEGEYVTKNKLTGEFDLSGKATSNKVVGYFAYFQLLNGFSKTIYMTVEQVKAWAAQYSPSSKSSYSPWQKEFPKMAMKTCLRSLLGRWGYMSVEMAEAINNDGDFNDGDSNGSDGFAPTKPLSFEDAQIVGDEKDGAAAEDKPATNPNNPGAGIQANVNFDNQGSAEAAPDWAN